MRIRLTLLAIILIRQFIIVLADAHAHVMLPGVAFVAANHGPTVVVFGCAADAADYAVVFFFFFFFAAGLFGLGTFLAAFAFGWWY
jgi:hypothetical protein